jgi:glycosyltransferase involved in cell wall biosynthesis
MTRDLATPDARRPRVLVSAYACEPDRGSEPGAGWSWALAAARDHDVWVITRANNRAVIERAARTRGEALPQFVYVDLPRWASFWKRGRRGIRLYYALWQLAAARVARRLHREQAFDVVHHLTLANLWYPALVCLVDAPFVLGPVGGGLRVPFRLYGELGLRGALADIALTAAQLLSRLNPLARIGWRRASLILVQNEETRSVLPRRCRGRAIVRPNASVSPSLHPTGDAPLAGNVALVAGQLVPLKGVSLALRALADLPDWRLLVVGEGPDQRRLERLARRLALGDRVAFHPWIPQHELWQLAPFCRAVLVPSLRENASFVSAEALALGRPVVAFDRGGPRVLARLSGDGIRLVPLGSRSECVEGLRQALLQARAARPKLDTFGPEATARDLRAVYRQAASSSSRACPA